MSLDNWQCCSCRGLDDFQLCKGGGFTWWVLSNIISAGWPGPAQSNWVFNLDSQRLISMPHKPLLQDFYIWYTCFPLQMDAMIRLLCCRLIMPKINYFR